MEVKFFQPTESAEGAAYVQDAFLKHFGGFTSFAAKGVWQSSEGKIYIEPVEVLTAETAEDRASVSWFMAGVAAEYGRIADQIAVFYVIDGEQTLQNITKEAA